MSTGAHACAHLCLDASIDVQCLKVLCSAMPDVIVVSDMHERFVDVLVLVATTSRLVFVH
jgi:hypothetical protein